MASKSARKIVKKAAKKYGVKPRLLWGVYGTESSFGKDLSTSSAGAQGHFQFIPSTAREYGVKPGSLKSSAKGAAHYLSDLGVQGDKKAALNSYSGGGGSTYASTVKGYAKDYSDPGKVGKKTAAKAPPKSKYEMTREPGKIKTVPGESHATERQAALRDYLLDPETQHDPDAPLRLALSVRGLQDEPDTTRFVKGKKTKSKAPQQDQRTSRQGGGGVVAPLKDLDPGSIDYGESRPGHTHAGEDYAAATGTPIQAVFSGTIKVGSDPSGYGTYVDLIGPHGRVARYAHLSKIGVKDGAKVSVGQILGKTGATGQASGPHLHFEIRKSEGFGFEGTKSPTKFLKKKAK